MSPEIIFGIGIVALLGMKFLGKLIPKRMPPQKSFKCGRCGLAALYNNRTAEAWRNGKTKFFCPACHGKWLQSRPHQEREHYSSPSSGGSGCLGVVLLFALVPIGTLVHWAYAYSTRCRFAARVNSGVRPRIIIWSSTNMPQARIFNWKTIGAVIGLFAGVVVFRVLLSDLFQVPGNGDINVLRLAVASLVAGIGTAIGYYLGGLASSNRAGGA